MSTRRIMILAGGTGGHVFPALAVAEELRTRGASVIWVGTQNGLEAKLVPQAGFPIEWMQLRALRRRNWMGLLGIAPSVLRAVLRGWVLLSRYRPAVVLGMGGYAASAVALAAWLRRIPLVVHEQNAVAGLTNRILSRLATQTLLGFPRARGIRQGTHVGNPVRISLLCAAKPWERPEKRPLHLLVIGGSQGAEIFNTTVPKAVQAMPPEVRPEVWHQTGSDPQTVAERYPDPDRTRVSGFIDAMDQAYAWADLVLARAGAMTLAELSVAARPALLVPYPHAADDHQWGNASQYADAGAAEVWRQNEFSVEKLAARLLNFVADPSILENMSAAALRQARPHATRDVASRLLEFCP